MAKENMNPNGQTKVLGTGLSHKFSAQGHDIHGHWDEEKQEYSFVYPDKTAFDFAFSMNGEGFVFSMRITPTSEYADGLERFVEKYIKADERVIEIFPQKVVRDMFKKYQE